MPDVDSVTRRRDRPYALSSSMRRSAGTTLSKLASGSPMPIITTLVMGGATLLHPRTRNPVREQGAIGVPQLPDDLAGRQVAVEALLAGRAERAVERAACLRRDAQRAAVVLGDVDRLHRVAVAGVEQPLARAVGGGGVADDVGPCTVAAAASVSRSGLARSVIDADVVDEALVDPPASPAARETASRRVRRSKR